MSKLKIAILIDQLVPGGVQKSAINEALELKNLGHQVTLFVLVRLDYSYQYEDLTRGLKIVYLSDANPRPFRRAIRIPYFSFLTHLHFLNPWFVSGYKVFKKFDFLISHGTTTCITAAAISRKFRVPYLAFIWDPMLYILEKVYGTTRLKFFFPVIKPITRFYESSFLTTAALVATSSKVHQQFIEKNYHVTPLVIYPGCAQFPPLKKNGNSILGYTRWELAKNPQLFLDLAKKLPGINILIAGNWTNELEKFNFLQEIEKQGLTSQIELLPKITQHDLPGIASRSFVWVHPHFEAFGMSGLEMAALGLPLIIPRHSGITELFTEGVHGFFPDKENTATYARYILQLLRNKQAAAKMGKNASRIAKKMTWKNHAKKIVDQVSHYLSQTKIVVLNTAYVSTNSIGGGDQFIIELAKRVPAKVHLTIITPHVGKYHWQAAHVSSPSLRFLVLPKTIFDNIDKPIPLFLAYLIRIFNTLFILYQLPQFTSLHSSTDIISDVIPAFYFRKAHKAVRWTARFFHFIETPLKRKGRFWVNLGSFILQRQSLWMQRTADCIMIDNRQIIRKLASFGIEENKISYHPGGVNQQLTIFPKTISADTSYYSTALVIGRLQEHKGVFDALDVWQKVTKVFKTARLTFIGYVTKETHKKLQKQIAQHHLEQNVVITGFISDHKMLLNYLNATKLLLFLDHEAGFGLVVAEAFAAGVPVVAYDLPIFGGLYKSGFITAPIKRTDQAANHVINLLSNQNLLNKIGQQAKKEAKKFDWNKSSNKFFSFLVPSATFSD